MEWPFLEDPESRLAEFSRLGLGAYSVPEMERWCGRVAYFDATWKVASTGLADLREQCVPLLADLWQQCRSSLPLSYPPVNILSFSCESMALEALIPSDVFSLSWGALLDRRLRGVRDRFFCWCQTHSFFDDWLRESAWTNLNGWATNDAEQRNLDWEYPRSIVVGEQQMSLWGEGIPTFRYRRANLSRPPAYDPGWQTWDDYVKKLGTYQKNQEQIFEQAGFHRTRTKRARSGSASAHIEWLVRYQVQGWSAERIAEEYDASGVGLDVASVREGIRNTAILIGLTLRTRIPSAAPGEG